LTKILTAKNNATGTLAALANSTVEHRRVADMNLELKETIMRTHFTRMGIGKTLGALALASVLATPAMAQTVVENYEAGNYAAPVAGAVIGTVAGVGLNNAWWGSGTTATSLGATVGSSIVAGGVIGGGAAALIDAALQPCRGFHAMFDLSHGECVNGQWVGYQEPPHMRRVYR
jgi:hypothetical protein